MSAKYPVRPGERFGRWTVVSESPNVGQFRMVVASCDCGSPPRPVIFQNIRCGASRSCGCLTRERTSTAKRTHGRSGTPEYETWCRIRERCYNQRCSRYEIYGGRGITVCDRWLHSFENFLADMGERPSPKHSIDRIDVNGNYEPGNCRWATARVQARNQRKTILSIEQLEELHARFGRGETVTDALSAMGIARRSGVSVSYRAVYGSWPQKPGWTDETRMRRLRIRKHPMRPRPSP
jgi:hypothetical protein